ncbi:MAG: CopG family antitoxin [Patescibacteria group bacterium]
MKMKKNTIPKFKSIKEEAKYWDTHSFKDHWDELEDFDLNVELGKSFDQTLILRLQSGVKNRIEKIAKSKGLNASTLARMWIIEKIKESR